MGWVKTLVDNGTVVVGIVSTIGLGAIAATYILAKMREPDVIKLRCSTCRTFQNAQDLWPCPHCSSRSYCPACYNNHIPCIVCGDIPGHMSRSQYYWQGQQRQWDDWKRSLDAWEIWKHNIEKKDETRLYLENKVAYLEKQLESREGREDVRKINAQLSTYREEWKRALEEEERERLSLERKRDALDKKVEHLEEQLLKTQAKVASGEEEAQEEMKRLNAQIMVTKYQISYLSARVDLREGTIIGFVDDK